jgi:hypothetical protein
VQTRGETGWDAAAVQTRLGLSEQFRAWLDRIDVPDQSNGPDLPDDVEADSMLRHLGVRSHDRAACLGGRPDPVSHPDLWWVLRRAYQDLVAKMGRNLATGGYSGWPALPDSAGEVGRQLYVWVFLAATPQVRRFHRGRGIPDDVSWTTLAALGREITSWSALDGGSGLNGTWMLPLVFQGVSYRLGRHAFDRNGSEVGVHIPGGEPLDPAASQASFDWARRFFPTHFPEESVTCFSCYSWLLDDQWAQYLPESSNIMQFQRRFHLLPEAPEADPASGDADILRFVFHRDVDSTAISPALLAELPQETTLQRAFVAHLRNGGHWRARNGWFPF